MKKFLCGLLVCSMFFVTACGEDRNSAVDDVLSEKIAAEEEMKAEVEEVVVEELEEVEEVEDVVEVAPEIVEEVTPEPEVIPEAEVAPEVEAVPEVEVVPEVEAVPEVAEEPSITERQVDVDLTNLSAIMVYAEVFNIVMDPSAYDGKVIKMNGPCFIYENPDTGEAFYAVIIQDATACCTQGLEFILAGDAVKPDDYPVANEMITVVGEVEAFEDFGMTFCRIINGVVL